jgi:hypothetical protein
MGTGVRRVIALLLAFSAGYVATVIWSSNQAAAFTVAFSVTLTLAWFLFGLVGRRDRS